MKKRSISKERKNIETTFQLLVRKKWPTINEVSFYCRIQREINFQMNYKKCIQSTILERHDMVEFDEADNN